MWPEIKVFCSYTFKTRLFKLSIGLQNVSLRPHIKLSVKLGGGIPFILTFHKGHQKCITEYFYLY